MKNTFFYIVYSVSLYAYSGNKIIVWQLYLLGKWGDFLQQTHSERQKDLVKPKIQIPALEWNTVLKPFRYGDKVFLSNKFM